MCNEMPGGAKVILAMGSFFNCVPTLAQESLHIPHSNQFAVPDARAVAQMLLEIQILLIPSLSKTFMARLCLAL
jgi:hypothetical protein